jgi:hypothetical protein
MEHHRAVVEEAITVEAGLFADAGHVVFSCREVDNGAVLEVSWDGISPLIFLSHLRVLGKATDFAGEPARGNSARKIAADPTLKFLTVEDGESLIVVEFPRSLRDLVGPVAAGVSG